MITIIKKSNESKQGRSKKVGTDNMGWRRKLIICLGACAGCVLLIALCVNYPAIDGFLRNFGRQDQGGTADYSTAEESLPVGNSGSGGGLPLPAPQQNPGGGGEIS